MATTGQRGRATPAPGAGGAAPARPLLEWALGLLLVLATLAAYERVRLAGFIWDDDAHLTENPCIVGPLGLADIWTSRAARHFPLVLTTFWAEHAAWGLNPLWFHLVNVLMHAACGVVLWRVLLRLGVPGAFLGAALWTLHPVQVESVAWITELKNTQSCLFYLLSVLFFLRWARGDRDGAPRGAHYAACLAFAALALTSKSSTVVLPFVLVLCGWWVRGEFRLRDAVRAAPVLLMALGMGLLALWTQRLEGASEPEFFRGPAERLAIAGRGVWFYLGKLAWPNPLIFIYPRWKVAWTHPSAYLPLAALAAALLALAWFRGGRLRPVFFAAAYFVIALSPVLGLIEGFFWRYSFVGDHFQYLASMGPLALAGAALASATALMGRAGRVLMFVACAGLLSVLGAASWSQSRIYRSDETLWRATIALNPSAWMAHNNLGAAYLLSGRPNEAIGQFEQAIALRGVDYKAHQNLGGALAQTGRLDDAVAHYRSALAIHPDFDLAVNGIGEVLLRQGRAAAAMEQFRRALAINPGLARAEENFGNALLQAGRAAEAAAHYRNAVAIDPRDAQAHCNLGCALATEGLTDEAAAEFGRALAINPRFVRALTNAGNAELQRGRWQAAEAFCTRALAIAPNDVDAHNNLAAALIQEGRLDEAISHCRRALEINPSLREARLNLAKALQMAGRGGESGAQFR